jgi:hypothetical protein
MKAVLASEGFVGRKFSFAAKPIEVSGGQTSHFGRSLSREKGRVVHLSRKTGGSLDRFCCPRTQGSSPRDI